MNKTTRKQVSVFLIAAALKLPAVLAFVLVDKAWAQPAIQTSSETTPTQQEETTQQPQGQGGSLMSAPSTTPEEGEKPAEQPQLQGPPSPTIGDVMYGEISQTILTTATWLDSFFGDRRYNTESNPSYVRFRYNVFPEKGSPLLLKPDLEARLILPQLKEKTHVIIGGTPKEVNQFSAVQSNTTSDPTANTEERGVITGVSYAPRQTPTESFFVRAGMKFSPKGVDPALGPVYRILFPFPSGWSLRFIEDVLWRSKEGWRSSSTIDLERPLRDLFFRASTEWDHTEHVEGFVYAFSFSLTQPLSSIAALQYSWVNIFQTRPVNELTEIDLRVSYRKRIWRDWLYYEVMPQYRFPRSRAFEATPGILFRLDMLFGNLTR